MKPSARTPSAYKQYEGYDLGRVDMGTIWAVGKTPEEAIAAFCVERMGVPLGALGAAIESPLDSPYEWGFRFACDGTSFKGAGVYITGCAVMTWWK